MWIKKTNHEQHLYFQVFSVLLSERLSLNLSLWLSVHLHFYFIEVLCLLFDNGLRTLKLCLENTDILTLQMC